MNLDRRLLKQVTLAKFALGVTVLTGFLGGLAVVIQARALAWTIDRVFLGGQTLSQVMPVLWALLGILSVRAVLGYLGETFAVAAAVRIKTGLRDLLAAHLLALGPAYTQGERSGELVNTAAQGVEAIDAYFSQFLPQLALAGMLPLAYLLVVFPLDPLSGLVLLLTGPLIPFFMFLIGHTAQSLTQKQWFALSRMSAYFLDTLQGLATLKALGRSREQAGRIGQVSERYREATMGVLRVTFLSALALELLGTIGTAIIAVEIGLRLLYGRMAFEPAFFILLLAPEFYFPLRQLGLRFHASMAGVSAARRIFEILEIPLPVTAPLPVTKDAPAAAQPILRAGQPFTIRFDRVCYTYPNRETPAVDSVSFEMRTGQVTALVGPSGAGKSTVAQLLLGFLQPHSGAIYVDGLLLAGLSLENWRAGLAWVPQQPHLFHATIAENLRVAQPDADLEDLRRVARLARLEEWIERLPQGFDTPVGEGGARLSGGQAQRMALARAFLRDAPLLVLDEPTAHLDVEQESLLAETTQRLCAGRTVLVIAHRLPTIQRAGQILVLQDGKVVEQGVHSDLVRRKGLYSGLLAAYSGPEPAGAAQP